MNAACALGLCVAGLRGQLRKLPFGVCTPRRLGPSTSRGSSWLGGLFWGRVSRSLLRVRPLYGVINGHVCKRRDEHLAACHGYLARRCGDYRSLAGAGRTLNGEEAVRRWGQRPLQSLHLPQVQRFLMEVLGAGRGLHLGASATTPCNVRLFSSRMRSAESLLLNPPDPRYQWQIDNSLWV